MNKSYIHELIVSIVLIVLLVLIVNPFGFFMPSHLEMMLLIALVVLYAVFAVFFWKESPKDEREDLHRKVAGRIAFLAGVVVMIAGIVVQTLMNTLDVWLVMALGATVLGKIVGRLYSSRRH